MVEPSEREQDEAWRQRFAEGLHKRLGLDEIRQLIADDVESIRKVEARLDLLEAKSGLRTPGDQSTDRVTAWLMQKTPWVIALLGLCVAIAVMTLGAIWFMLLALLKQWLLH